MTQRVYLHVGTPKSGTTYLQSVLRGNKKLLGDAGVLVPGNKVTDVVRAGLVIREDPRVAELDDDGREAWNRIVAEVRSWQGETAIISYELLGAASETQAQKAIADLGAVEVHVVVTARDFTRTVPSAWQERLKFAVPLPLEDVLPSENAEFGWLSLDPRGAAKRWGSTLPRERVHIVTVPPTSDDPDELWRRFASACEIDIVGLDLGSTTANESLGATSAELLRRVNLQLEKDPGPFVRSQIRARWLRNMLAHRILVPLDGGRLGVSDAQHERWSDRADAAITELAAAGYDVHGDLEDLRSAGPGGRRPGDVTDGELLDLGVKTIIDLLIRLREQTLIADSVGSAGTVEPTDEEPALRQRVKSVARRAAENTGATYVNQRMDKLAERIAELEAEVQRSRVLQRRVAELDDLVCELLVPTAEQDSRTLVKALRKYRRDSL